MKIFPYLRQGVVLSGLIVVQTSFIPVIPFFAGRVNVVLVYIVLTIFNEKHRLAIYSAFILGWLLELFTVYPAGVMAGSLVLATIFLVDLAEKFLTNRSILSLLALTVFGAIIYNIILGAMLIVLSWFKIGDFVELTGYFSWLEIIKRSIGNLGLIILVYFISNKIGKLPLGYRRVHP